MTQKHLSIDISKALADIKSFFLEAGDLAVRNQKSAKVLLKNGQLSLTETDLAISKMAQSRLSHWFQQPGHILLDEESIHQVGTPEEVFAESEYQWVLDPIDGTAGYAMGRKMWGISLGLLHNGAPIAGGIYLPVFQEMLLADHQKAWRIEHAGTPQEEVTELGVADMDVHSQTFVESRCWANINWGKDQFWKNTPESAVQGLYSTLVGQAAGVTLFSGWSIWDCAGAAAVALRAGYTIRTMKDGQKLERLTADNFQSNWKLTENWLLCAEKNFTHLHKILQSEMS